MFELRSTWSRVLARWRALCAARGREEQENIDDILIDDEFIENNVAGDLNE